GVALLARRAGRAGRSAAVDVALGPVLDLVGAARRARPAGAGHADAVGVRRAHLAEAAGGAGAAAAVHVPPGPALHLVRALGGDADVHGVADPAGAVAPREAGDALARGRADLPAPARALRSLGLGRERGRPAGAGAGGAVVGGRGQIAVVGLGHGVALPVA